VAGFKQAEASARRTATAATAASSKAQAAQKRQASAVSGGGPVAFAAAAAIGAYGGAAVKAVTDTAASAGEVLVRVQALPRRGLLCGDHAWGELHLRRVQPPSLHGCAFCGDRVGRE